MLPDLGFLVKPIMVVVGITLGGTVLTILGADLWTWWRKRNDEKKEAIRKQEEERRRRAAEAKLLQKENAHAEKERKRRHTLMRFDYLVEWHESRKYASAFSRSKIIDDQGTAVEYAYDLVRLRLIRPDLYETITSWGSDKAADYLAAVRSKFKMRGLDAAKELVERWKMPEKPESKLDTRPL